MPLHYSFGFPIMILEVVKGSQLTPMHGPSERIDYYNEILWTLQEIS